jgi:fluoride exporter
MIRDILLVGAGGAAGSIARYLIRIAVPQTAIPWHTLIVNITGCFLVGILFGLSQKTNALPAQMQLLLMTGFCGGFTTFSALGLEGFMMLSSQRYLIFFLYFAASVLFGLAATFLGHWIVRN